MITLLDDNNIDRSELKNILETTPLQQIIIFMQSYLLLDIYQFSEKYDHRRIFPDDI